MENLIVTLIILGIFIGASAKILIDKKNGVVCSGCPSYKSGKGDGTQNCACPSQGGTQIKL